MWSATALLLSCLMAAGPMAADPSTEAGRSTLPGWVVRSSLGLGYLAGAAYAAHYWWKAGVGRNPFANIGEDEPYLEDKIWHLWNGENLTDLHYWALSNGWGRRSPWRAMGMSLLVLTSVELFDASNRDGYWKLSLFDEAAGIAGIMLWYAKHRWPGRVPLEVRVGIRQWGRATEMFGRLTRYPQERDKQSFCHYDDYAILKTEFIYRPHGFFYIGGTASLKSDGWGRGQAENLFGATVGFDLTRHLARRDDSQWARALDIFGRYFSTSVAYTHWFER